MLNYKEAAEKYLFSSSPKKQANKEDRHSSSSESESKKKNWRKRSYAEVLTFESSRDESSSDSEKANFGYYDEVQIEWDKVVIVTRRYLRDD